MEAVKLDFSAFGAVLRREREMRDVSLDEIARATRISKHLLESLEAGRAEALPESVFVKAYIRSYAECIGADANNLVSRYMESCKAGDETHPGASLPHAPHLPTEETDREHRWAVSTLAAASLVAFIGVGVLVAKVSHHAESVPAHAVQAAAETVDSPARRSLVLPPDSVLSIEATAAVRVFVERQGETVLNRELAAGEVREYPTGVSLVLTAEPGNALRVALDSKAVPPISGQGTLSLTVQESKMEYGYIASDSPVGTPASAD